MTGSQAMNKTNGKGSATKISLDRVSKFYQSGAETVHAVKEVSLNCDQGELVGILGPSGCGKSSLLRMICGLEEISAGEITIGSRVVNPLPPEERNVSIAFENYALYPNLSVYDNLAFPLQAAKRYSREEVRKKVVEIADQLRLKDVLQSKPAALSGGQQQGVSLGRALIKEADLYLLDEPLSHLDLRYRSYIAAEIKRLHKFNNWTMLLITHDQEEALEMADRIAVMNGGVFQQIGTPSEILNHPVNRFVADFVGEPPMNFFDAQLVSKEDRLFLATEGFRFPAPPQLEPIVRDLNESEVVVGIRPMHIRVGSNDNNSHAIKAPLFIYEMLGERAVVTVEFGKGRLQAVADTHFRPQLGEVVSLALDPDRLHIFSKRTERALC
jgi:multiple sugar transport system ATP-binding protein